MVEEVASHADEDTGAHEEEVGLGGGVCARRIIVCGASGWFGAWRVGWVAGG